MKTRRLPRFAKNAAAETSARRKMSRAVGVEMLEMRQLMTLLGVVPQFPRIDTTGTGLLQYNYDSNTHVGSFDVSAAPFTYQQAPGAATNLILGSRAFEIHFKTDASGNVLGGVAGADFVVNGTVDLNNNFIADPGEPTGTLLSGEILQFGHNDAAAGVVDNFDFRFVPTGGSLLSQPGYAGQDIGVVINAEGSTFAGSFTSNFSATRTKATVGPIAPLPISLSGIKTQDLTGDGFSADDTGLEGTTINLFRDTDNDGVLNAAFDTLVATTKSLADGSYSFTGLVPARYFVQEDPGAGYTQTGGLPYYTVNPSGGQTVTGLNFANFRNITISGTKYNDITGDAISGDDTPLKGVTIQLFKDGNLVGETVTDTNGAYAFPNLGPGVYTVKEVVPAGSTQTAGVGGYTITATSGVDASQRDFANFRNITITGTKTTDITGNGFSGDDTPLAGVVIQLFKDGGTDPVATTTTGADGSYAFTNLGPGNYVVKEVLPAGYIQTGGLASYTITARSGADSAGNNFANFKKITITGNKKNDITGNGLTSDDVGLGGVTIELYRNGAFVGSTTTLADGSYSFPDLGPGDYLVKEVVPAGSVATAGQAGYTITAQSGVNVGNRNFANFTLVTISGKKFNDLKGDGITGDDLPLGGVTINLYRKVGSTLTLISSTVTGADGTFAFPDVGPGRYVVREVVPTGSIATVGSAGYEFDVVSGQNAGGNNFANFKKITISGTKYKDITGNSFSGDDVPFAGVTINLYADSDRNTVIATTKTGSDGSYKFENLGPGTYWVQELLPPGYIQTGGQAGYTIAATSGQNSGGNNFANWAEKPGIDLEKTTNGPSNSNPVAPNYDNEDAPNGAGVPVLTPGSSVTWTYRVTNTGNTTFTASQITLVDDNGTPTTSDDFSIANGTITFLSVEVGDGDNLLEPGEVWIYRATGTVQNLGTSTSSSPAVTFDFSGNSAQSGTAGNIRTFSAGGINVHASAYARVRSSGAWSKAYLGSYSGGLGVTDSSEGNGSSNKHTVNNGTRDNYILLEFSEQVVVDAAYLGYVVGDSDMTIWIGTLPNAYNNHTDLSDAVLASLGFTEVNLTSSSSARLADLNAGGIAGNVLVIAAKTTDSDDKFKVETVKVKKAVAGIYANKATVTVPGDSDSDNSHYRNPEAPSKTSISGTKWKDLSGNGQSDDDVPLKGVTIKLYQDRGTIGVLDSADTYITSTVTGSNGTYNFDNLAPGQYIVQEVVASGYIRTGPTNSDYYAVNAAVAGQTYTGYDFANFDKSDCLCGITNVYYIINGSQKVTDLRGKTNAGDTVQAVFTILPGNTQTLTLVSYTAPGASFSDSTASQQKIYDIDTGTFGPGTYTLTVANPSSYYQVDFVCGLAIDTFGPAGSNIFYTPQGRLLSADNDGPSAPIVGKSSISGFVFVDSDNDGEYDLDESPIAGIDVSLYSSSGSLIKTVKTGSDGKYIFTNLAPGTYAVAENQADVTAKGYIDGKDQIGTNGGTFASEKFSGIVIKADDAATFYNFGERLAPPPAATFGADMTATIGYWQNNNGQALIKCLNGSQNAKNLGNWLASNLPNLFGSGSPWCTSNKTNAQVADIYKNVFKSAKSEAQAFALALSIYVTDSDLAGGTYAKNYGFKVSSSGTGAATFNIGSAGSVLGLSNNGAYSILAIIKAVDSKSKSGYFQGTNSTKSAFVDLLSKINETGDI